MVTLEFFAGTMVVLFGALIGCYAYVHKANNETRRAMNGSLGELKNSINALNVEVADRLGRVETILKERAK